MMTKQEENMEITIEDITNKVKELLESSKRVEKWFTPVFESNKYGNLTPKGNDTTYKIKELVIHVGTEKTPSVSVSVDGMDVGTYSRRISGVKELIKLLDEAYENEGKLTFDFFRQSVLEYQEMWIKDYFGK